MKKFFYLTALVCALAFVSCKSTQQAANSNASYGSDTGQLADSRGVPDIDKIGDPVLKQRIEKIRNSLKQSPPVLQLEDNIDADQKAAQELALRDDRFLREIR